MLTEQCAQPGGENDSQSPAELINWKDWCELEVKTHVVVFSLMVEEAATWLISDGSGLSSIQTVKFPHFSETPSLCEGEPFAV